MKEEEGGKVLSNTLSFPPPPSLFPTLMQLLVHRLYLFVHPRSSDDVIERLLSLGEPSFIETALGASDKSGHLLKSL